jgi:flagellar hook-associated protein 3 FlgL
MLSERAVSAMLEQQRKVSNTQLQLSSGRRLQSPADDPASAARIIDLSGAIERNKQYQSNGDRAQARLEREESVLIGASNLLQRANELTIQGNNDVLGQSDTQAIAVEMRQLLNELFSLANTRDSNGEYIFAGYQSNTRPFSQIPGGGYSYAGDLGQRMLQISPDRQIADGNHGHEVFVNVTTYPVAAVTTNAATAFTAINAGDITIDGGNGNGPILLGAIPPAADASERAQQLRDAIEQVYIQTGVSAESATSTTLDLLAVGGDGITLSLSGTADTATTGLVAGTYPSVSSTRNIFETLEQVSSQLENNGRVDRYIGDIQLALENILEVRSSVGGRLNAIEEQHEVNEDIELVLQAHIAEEEDLDYAEAITRFERQMVALQAAQQSYVKIQSLSLFNYIS